MMTQKHTPVTTKVIRNSYDYVIVGAGAAGSVVASRLSEKECVSVLLLEAGKPPPKVSDIPAAASSFAGTDIDWKYSTAPQEHTGRGLINNKLKEAIRNKRPGLLKSDILLLNDNARPHSLTAMKNHFATLGWVAYITALISHQVTFICFRLWRRCSPEGALETMLKSNKPLNASPVCKAMSFLGGLFEAHQVV
ncbi:glucose dehydrogenase [Trichonephila clavipes]|nr:glucose dehydrogenase [Trichonephila clavipes]